MNNKRNFRLSRPARIALGYVAAAVLWILLSDGLVAALVPSAAAQQLLQTWKGVGFVVVTALVIYALMRLPTIAPDEAGSDRLGAVLLGLTFLLLAALIAGAGVLGYRYQAAAFKAQQHSQQTAIAELKAGQIERWVEWRRQEVELLRHDPDLLEAARSLASGPAQDAARHVRMRFDILLKSGRWSGAGLYAPDGRPLLQAHEGGEPAPALRRAIAEAAAGHAFRLNDVHAADAAGTAYRIDLLAPIAGSAAVLVLSADPLSSLFPMAQSFPIPSNSSEVLLLRVEGDEIVFVTPPRHAEARPLELRQPLATTALGQLIAQRHERHASEGPDYRGVEVLAAVREVAGAPWFIAVKTDAEEVMAPLRRQGNQILAMAALSIGIAGLFVAFLWRSRQAAFALRERKSRSERAALADRLEALFRQARESILLIDPAGLIVEANEAALAAYGYTAEEIRRIHIRDLRTPEAQASLERDYQAADRPEGVQFETWHRRKDGSAFPVEVSAQAIEIDGRRYRQSFIRDISARRQAEEKIGEQLKELQQWYAATLDREGRVAELKAEVNELRRKLGEPPRYGNSPPDDQAGASGS